MNTRTLPTMRTLFLSLFALPLLALLAAPARAAEPAPAPDLTGVYTGKLTGKRYSQETGEKPVSKNYVVEATITQIGSDISIETTLTDKDGNEAHLSFQGKTGNRVFWAFNGDTNQPFVVLGKVAGKLPKLSISGKGTSAGSNGFSELKLSLKRSKTGVLGTSATGAAVVGATVTLKDHFGTAVATETDSEGRYSLNVVGLTPPFLVKVDPLVGSDLYGIASAAGVANVTPFTTLILDMWYGVQDIGSVVDVFGSLDETTPVPSALEVALIESLVRRVIQKWLQDNDIDSDSFNLLTTPFDADGTGVDAVLDITSVTGTTSLTIDDGATSQTSDIDVNDATGTVTIDTTTTSPGGTTMSTDGTAIPDGDAAQAAVAGALATMEGFRNKINTRGAALALADLQGYGTVDFLDDGRNRTRFFGEMAADLRGGSLGPVTLKSVGSFNGEAGTLSLDLELHVQSQEGDGTELFRANFKKTGSAWLLHGNRQIAEFGVQVEYRTDYLAGSTDGPNKHINVDIRAEEGTIASVTVSGATVFDGQTVPKSEYTELVVYEPTPGTEVQYEKDVFYTGADFVEYPAPGTPITLTVTPTVGSPVEYVVYTQGTTTEAISLTQPTGHDLVTHAHPGTPVTVEWTLPTSFAIRQFKFHGDAFSDNFETDVDANGTPVIGDTTGTLTYPTMVGGEAINRAGINLSFEGPNGERIHIIYSFESIL